MVFRNFSLVVLILMFTQCKKSGDENSSNQSKSKIEAQLPGRAGVHFALLPKLWKIVTKMGGKEELFLSRGLLKHPAFKEIFKIISEPDFAGIDTNRHIRGSFYFGDEEGWKRSSSDLKKWSEELIKEKTGTPWVVKPSNPYQKKLVAIIKKTPWLQHRIIIPLKKRETFDKFITNAVGSVVSKGCPIENGKLIDGIYITKKLGKNCKPFPRFRRGAADIIAFSGKVGNFVALRIYNNSAQVDFLDIPAYLKGFDFDPLSMVKTVDRKTTGNDSQKGRKGSTLFVSTRWQSFTEALNLNGGFTGIAAIHYATPETKISMLKEIVKIVSFAQHFIKNASFLASGVELKINQKEEVVLTWKLTKLGKVVFGKLLNETKTPVDGLLLNNIVNKVRSIQLKSKSRMGNLDPMKMMNCGLICTAECINRLAMGCWISTVSKNKETIKNGFNGSMVMGIRPLLTFLKSPKLSLSKGGQLQFSATLKN